MDHETPDTALPRLASGEELAARGAGTADTGSGELRAKVANAMVGLKKEHYGRGPTAAKAWFLDDYLFVAMEGGLTRNEETLLAAGREEVVRSYRLTFEEVVSATVISAVEELTGRTVATYHSQIVFDPPRSFEVFVFQRE